MKALFKTTLVIISVSIIISCNQKSNETNRLIPVEDSHYNYTAIADTIITDVVIKNPNNDEWIEYSLRNLDKDVLVKELFELVYDGKLTPHNFFSDEPLSIDEVKELEKSEDYSRDNIAKVQFEESWKFDKENLKMQKQVYSIMLAYEVYYSDGSVKGYKPIFKIYFK